MVGLLGLALILATCYLLSTDRKRIKPGLLLWGLGLQFSFAIIVLKTPFGTPCTGHHRGSSAFAGMA